MRTLIIATILFFVQKILSSNKREFAIAINNFTY